MCLNTHYSVLVDDAPVPLCGPTDGKICKMLGKLNTLQFDDTK